MILFLDQRRSQVNRAVNTILWDVEAKTVGHNTDHTGFKALEEQTNALPKKALILGTGGASDNWVSFCENPQL